MEICAVGAELFHAEDEDRDRKTDRQTNMRLVVISRNFAKAQKNTGCFRGCFYNRQECTL